MSSATRRTTLNFPGNNIKNVLVIRGWVYLEAVVIEHTEGRTKPKQIRINPLVRWEDLVEINLDDNSLNSLPPLPRGLESLRISENPLGVLPSLVEGMRNLEARGCGLRVCPHFPRSMRTVDLSHNRLEYLPPLSRVIELRVSDNPLTHLPTNLGPDLRYLDARNGCLDYLPRLPSTIEYLNVRGNPLSKGVDREFVPYLLRIGVPSAAYELFERRLATRGRSSSSEASSEDEEARKSPELSSSSEYHELVRGGLSY